MTDEVDWMDKLTSDRINKAIEASEDPEQTIQEMSDMLTKRTRQLQKEYWERCRFCNCGADNLRQCECDPEKKKRFLQRRKRKINEEIGNAPFTILVQAQNHGVDLKLYSVKNEQTDGDTE